MIMLVCADETNAANRIVIAIILVFIFGFNHEDREGEGVQPTHTRTEGYDTLDKICTKPHAHGGVLNAGLVAGNVVISVRPTATLNFSALIKIKNGLTSKCGFK